MSTPTEMHEAGPERRWVRFVLLGLGAVLIALIALEEPAAATALGVAALVPAWLARRKGRDALGWWIGGVVAWLPALVLVLLARNERRRCPACGAGVPAAATSCAACGADIAADAVAWRERPPERLLGVKALALAGGALIAFLLLLSILAEVL